MRKGNFDAIGIKILSDLFLLAIFTFSLHNHLFFMGLGLINPGSVILATIFVCWFLCARMLGLYTDYRLKPFSFEWVVFLKTLGLYTLLISFVFAQIPPPYKFSGSDLIAHCSLIFLVLPVEKLVIRLLLKKIRNSNGHVRKVLIVGSGHTAMDFYKHYVKNKQFGYQLAGFVDDQPVPTLNGHYLGKTSDLNRVISNHELDDIIVTSPGAHRTTVEEIISIGEQEGKRIRIIPDFQGVNNVKLHMEQLGELPIITVRSLPLDFSDNKLLKRTFDLVVSIILIIGVFSWLFPIIALIIKLTSKGPVFFKQERWGLNNRTIVCWKFRSMVASSKDTDEQGRYQQATKNDPRVTPIGRFLRKSNLDELPQFFNVLLGSMSLVGPRPHPVPLNKISKDSIEKYMMRHWVKPGITGWAQVSGYRGETKVPYLMKKRVEHDLWYMENWTFWLDLQILVQTVVNMVKGEKNAY
jgi:putative colanic acid biosynthesis UDP-glucose lipid carrier transferase